LDNLFYRFKKPQLQGVYLLARDSNDVF